MPPDNSPPPDLWFTSGRVTFFGKPSSALKRGGEKGPRTPRVQQPAGLLFPGEGSWSWRLVPLPVAEAGSKGLHRRRLEPL